MKAYTDLNQSKKLAEILPLESADMHWGFGSHSGGKVVDKNYYLYFGCGCYEPEDEETDIPAWSLTRLFDIMPGYVEIVKDITPEGYEYICYTSNNSIYKTTIADNPVDACYEMIIKLHEQNLL